MRYDEFEAEFSAYLSTVKAGTRRVWKLRGVPDAAVTKARGSVTKVVAVTVQSVTSPVGSVTEAVTKPKALQASVTDPDPALQALQVAIPSAEDGHPEFDIMTDGLARGFAGDTWQRTNRTAHAIRRMAERTCGIGTDDATALAKTMIAEWEKLRRDCPAGPDGDVCRVAVLERVSKMTKAEKRFAVTAGVK